MSCHEHLALSRRGLIGGSASLALWSLIPRAAVAGSREPRLLTIVLRGALDGLALAAPAGDPEYSRLRSRLALPREGDHAGLPLDGFFLLNAAMPYLHGLYGKREALIVHAVATPYRGRSHFDGQDVLESGLGGVQRADEGWLNRALQGLPHAGRSAPQKGLAMAAVVPLVMRGRASVLTYSPKAYSAPLREATIQRLSDLYAAADPALAKAFAEGVEIDRVANGAAVVSPLKGAKAGQPGGKAFKDFVETAAAAARFMSAAEGPRVGALAFDGWDTHANEGAITGLLANRLAGLDAALKTFGEGMGAAWKDTVVVVVTEFGRTVAINGTDGTDHGTATVALVLGGAVKGGRVLADWPGLGAKALYEGRDLAPTRDLRSILKGVLRDHLGIPDEALAGAVFPGSAGVRAIDGLLA